MWRTYRFTWELTGREVREAGRQLDPGFNRRNPNYALLEDFYRNAGAPASSSLNWEDGGRDLYMNAYIVGHCETALLKRDIPTVYVESRSLAEAAYKAKLELTFDSIRLPMPLFSFAVPEGLVFNGVPIEPFILTNEPFLPQVALDEATNLDAQDRVEYSEMVEHRHALTIVERPAPWMGLSYAVAGEDGLQELVNGDTLADRSPRAPVMGRLAVALLAFYNAFPHLLRDGFPEAMKQRDQRIARNAGLRPHRLDLPEEFRGSPAAHWRRWHFRTLRDERFRRNDDGSYRVTFVRDSVVGKVVPKTLVEGEDPRDVPA